MENSNKTHITLKLVETFVKGNPFERFYKEATRGFSYREKAFIEDRFVDSSGRRNSISESEFLRHVPNGKKLLEGDTRILQRTSVSSDGSDFRIELIHDSLASAIHEEKNKNYQRRTFIQRIFLNGIFDTIVLTFNIFLYIFILLSQNSLLLYTYEVPLGLLLVFSIYMLGVTRIHKDSRIDAFILPVLAISIFNYLQFTSIESLFAYHVIKPSLIKLIYKIDLFLNFSLVCLCIYSRLYLFTKEKDDAQGLLNWSDFFSRQRKENWFAQIALLAGFVLSTFLILFSPKTHFEKTRELAERGDTDAMIELGNYYLEYDMDKEKAKDWFLRAHANGIDVESSMSKIESLKPMELTDTMKAEAIYALLKIKGKNSLPIIKDIIEKQRVEEFTANEIRKFYDSIKDGKAVIRWYTYITQNYSPHGCVGLGFELWRGEYVEQDMKRAFELYEKGSSNYNLALCYWKGWGVEKDLDKALKESSDQQIPGIKFELIINAIFGGWFK